MTLLASRLEDITESDLNSLITERIPESAVLEYKRELVGTSDRDRYEFLADVSSFANTTGGEILFGIEESNGIPTKLVGADDSSIDQEILRLEQIVRTGSRPAIRGITTRAIPLGIGKSVLVMRIPRSWEAPHQIGQPGSFRFFGRASNGKYQLDVDALKLAFRQGPELADRIKSFRADRLGRILSNLGPAKLKPGSKIVLHLVPIGTFSTQSAANLNPIKTNTLILSSILQSGGQTRVNLDGYLASAYKPNEGNESYAQLFRDGLIEVVEFVERWEVRGHNFLPGQQFDEIVQKIVAGAQKIYKTLEIDAPVVAMLTLLGMQGRLMRSGKQWGYEHDVPFDSQEILCPDVLIEDLNACSESIAFPIVNLAWNAVGYEQSAFYDKHGKWIGR